MEELNEEQYIKDILVKIQVIDPEAFERFASEHSICFQKGNGNWLFPMMYDYYVNKLANEEKILYQSIIYYIMTPTSLIIKVADNGIGINHDEKDYILSMDIGVNLLLVSTNPDTVLA